MRGNMIVDIDPERLTAARHAMLNNEVPPADAVRGPILASWRRSQDLNVSVADVDLGSGATPDSRSPLQIVAAPVLEHASDLMATEPMSLILCDDAGVVIDRITSDTRLGQHLDRVWLAPGFSYAESTVGTNGIGTTLESRGPTHVFGREHWIDSLEELACAGAPIRHPVTGKVLGIVDLTGWDRHSGELMITTASLLAQQIEEALLAQTRGQELALLEDYLTSCNRHSGAVLALGDEVLMLNNRAQSDLDGADRSTLVAVGREALAGGRDALVVMTLPSGVEARVQVRPTERLLGSGVSGVLLVTLQRGDLLCRRPTAPRAGSPGTGAGALWEACRQTVDRHFTARDWVILTGEPGVGKRILARTTHLNRTPTTHLRILDAEDPDQDLIAQVVEELDQDGGTLVLTHLDALSDAELSELLEVLEPLRESTAVSRPWVVGTVRTPRSDAAIALEAPALDLLIETFPHTVEVPPLRHHPEDVAELVRLFSTRLCRGGELRFTATALAMLARHHWPGNVTQLYNVMRKITTRQRAGQIEVADLPPEIWTSTRRRLTPLEAIESDAIVRALLDAGGNKTEAARLLGMSRATIYRKVHTYGIEI